MSVVSHLYVCSIKDPENNREFYMTHDYWDQLKKSKTEVEAAGLCAFKTFSANYDDYVTLGRRVCVTWIKEETGVSRVAILMLLNKKKDQDFLVGEGTNKTVTYAIDMETGDLVASLGIQDNVDEIGEIKALNMLDSKDGFVHLLGYCFYVNKRGEDKTRLFQPVYSSLRDTMHSQMERSDKRSIAFQITFSLAKLHEKYGHMHRDFNSGQVMLDDSKKPSNPDIDGTYLTFIGDVDQICRINGDEEKRSIAITTPTYMSPEYAKVYSPIFQQAQKDLKENMDVDSDDSSTSSDTSSSEEDYPDSEQLIEVSTSALDIWSLGCVYYELFTGSYLPWMGLSSGEQMEQIAKLEASKDLYQMISQDLKENFYGLDKFPNLSQEEKKLLTMALTIDPNKRPSASELLKYIKENF